MTEPESPPFDPRYPLGAPVRPEKPDREAHGEWVADDPGKPNIQRNTRTGKLRNVAPTPNWHWWMAP